ncbi:protein of unknown function (plasmid) [Azospirillum lipoferum 4B]|uniref:Uncharacterized protein n=1 Tax=Azospirillum lipoferum (strain 4B) TaxID=862719 RepID=G7ZEN5_AZOL4|nr:protein of unknown function [Azospirillum lipoferum 4B]
MPPLPRLPKAPNRDSLKNRRESAAARQGRTAGYRSMTAEHHPRRRLRTAPSLPVIPAGGETRAIAPGTAGEKPEIAPKTDGNRPGNRGQGLHIRGLKRQDSDSGWHRGLWLHGRGPGLHGRGLSLTIRGLLLYGVRARDSTLPRTASNPPCQSCHPPATAARPAAGTEEYRHR